MFKNINQFGYRNYSNEELMMINKKANSNVDFDKVNKLLKEQMIRESKKELELLKGSLNDFDNRIDKLYKEIRFLEKRTLLAINDEQLARYEKQIFDLECKIDEEILNKKDIEKEIASINKSLNKKGE